MKLKKLLFCLLPIVAIFCIYKFTFHVKINYVALGDSLALGKNPYGNVGYGYTDYIADYLKNKGVLQQYIHGYAQSGYKIQNVMDDILLNRTIQHNDQSINIKRSLRESHLLTISVGANDLIGEWNFQNIGEKFDNPIKLEKRLDEVSKQFEQLIVLIKKYAKGKIVVTGYYNPFPGLQGYKKQIDKVVQYGNSHYKRICEKHDIDFVDIFGIFENRFDYLPNPLDIHPNVNGYRAIFNRIQPYLPI